MSMASLTLTDELEMARQRIKNPEQVLGSTIVQPFTGANSGNRKIMWATHHQHKLNLDEPEVPFICTANENEFVKHSSAFVLTDCDKTVLSKVEKFRDVPGLHYWLIVVNQNGPNAGMLDVIERVSFIHTTESYGFQLNTEFLDSLKVGSFIPAGSRERCPGNVDQYGNLMDGVNLLTMYESNLETQEDGYELSDTAAKKLGVKLFHFIPIPLNDNDIMLNIYGDNNEYKVMPDIGEEVKNGILLAIRRQNNADALFSQTWNRLKQIMIGDKRYTVNGTLIDLEIYSNNFDQFDIGPNAQYHTQIRGYLYNKIRYCGEIVSCVDDYLHYNPNQKVSFRLQHLYSHCKDTITHVDHYRNGKKYSGTTIEFMIMENMDLNPGDKITNRYGGKGVVSKIVPEKMMPIFDGRHIEVKMNHATVGGRLNYAQLIEMEANFRSCLFVEHLIKLNLPVEQSLLAIGKYMSFYSSSLAQHFFELVDHVNPEEWKLLFDSYIEKGIIRLALRPISDQITIDTLAAIDDEYPWMKPQYLTVPIINSNGKLRYINKSMRPIVAGYQFFLRLKQYAVEKFSCTSISTVNLKNENSKSRAGKFHETPVADTPIKFGSMETEDMTHMDEFYPGITEITLMLYSSSSEMRNNFFNLYFGNPVSINIELDEKSASRSAEIFATYFKQLGDRLVFTKHLKEKVNPPYKIKLNLDPPYSIKSNNVQIPFKIDVGSGTFVPTEEFKKNPQVAVPVFLEGDTITTEGTFEEGKKYWAAPFTIRIDR